MTRPRARDVMTRELITLAPEQDVVVAMRRLLEHRISGAPVVDARGNLVGMLTQRDCLRVAYAASYHQEPAGTVSSYMSQPVETIPADLELVEVIGVFLRSPYRRFPVLGDNRVVGIVSRRDALSAALALLGGETDPGPSGGDERR
jgi:CBS domain-containing protein